MKRNDEDFVTCILVSLGVLGLVFAIASVVTLFVWMAK